MTVQFVSDLPRWRAASGSIRASEGIELLEGPPSNPRPTKNRLFENRLGRFVDVTDQAGVGDASSGRDAVFFDMDSDGDLDLFVVNGGTAFSNQPDVLYRNNGDRTFENITAEVGLEGPARGRGATVVALDIDNDLDLDLFVTNGDGPPGGNRGPYVLWRNDLPQGKSARLDLHGPSGNTAAIGVRVRLETPRLVLLQQRRATSSRFSTSVSPIHLGLGSLDEARVLVEWPGGDRETLTVVPGESVELVQSR